MSRRILLPLPGAGAFAERLALAGGFELGQQATRRFPDGERYLRLGFNPAGRAVDIVGELSRADDQFLTLAFAADTLRELGAREVGLVAPYLGYMRQDARFQPGEALTSRTFARLVSGLVDRLVTVDPHLHRFGALSELYAVPSVTLHAAPLIGDWIAREVDAPLVIGPDAESEQWASQVAGRANAPFAVLSKQRFGDRDVQITLPELGLHAGRQPVLIDDIASSGRTLVAASAALQRRGFPPPVCVVVHAIFGEDALLRVTQAATRVVSTDTIAHETNAISVAPLIADLLVQQEQ
jgi:ribose-phosphate pyrophosphokinase